MKNKRKKPGLVPGSVVFTGKRKVENVVLTHLQFNATHLLETTLERVEDIASPPESPDGMVDWYDIRGLHDNQLIESLGSLFDIHPLILEDISDTYQRPKFEEFDNGNFILLKSLSFDDTTYKVQTEQIVIFFRKGLLISFQETVGNLFETVRQRLLLDRGKIRKRDADYLAYALLDIVIDHYFITLDGMEEVIESLEADLLLKPDGHIKERIHFLKKELLIIRRNIAPLRDSISRFSKSDSTHIMESSIPFIRDLYDHIFQIIDTTETYRDTLNGLQELYLSEISFRMNQVMKVLTVITTIFVPLSFLAALYGMNFEYMPELHFKYAYFLLLLIMFVLAGGLLVWFKRKKWI